ncbi:hypothetical protein F5Y16DRAFT_419139 [Xylariaceae sp. FL0255]|nr:hypothetical protein F5Y16DRAFT_419139 [Xylariaceae sp. FL0255]
MASGQARFVAVDLSRAGRASRNQSQLFCPTCFEPFQTDQALRNHVAGFQVQIHLPSIVDQGQHDSDYDDDYDDDDDDEDDRYDYDDDEDHVGCGNRLQIESRVRHHCPYPSCRRKRPFWKKAGLVRHYQSHTRCYEICVFCRSPFNQVQKFLRHKCTTRPRETNRAKQFYRKERCAQLRRYSLEMLNAAADSDKNRGDQARKRGHDTLDVVDLEMPSKKPRGTKKVDASHHRANGETFGSYSAPFRLLFSHSSYSHNCSSTTNISMLPTPTQTGASQLDGPPLDRGMARENCASGLLPPFSQNPTAPEGTWAPMFGEFTITPCYDAMQDQQMHQLLPQTVGGHFPIMNTLNTQESASAPANQSNDSGYR